MKIKVRFTSTLKDIVGIEEMVFDLPDGAKLDGLLTLLGDKFGGRVLGTAQEYQWRHGANYVVVTINGLVVNPKKEIPLHDGAEVTLFPPLSGG